MNETERTTMLSDQVTLAAALLDPGVYGGTVERVEKLETHISYVFLAGAYAYKIKKAVDFGFLNFLTLQARQFYCREELRLNRRFAPSLYLDIVTITGSPGHPVLSGDGPPIEYAVKMRRFPQDGLLSHVLARNELAPTLIDRLAERIADVHASANVATSTDVFGTFDTIQQPALDNFSQMRAAASGVTDAVDLNSLEQWTRDQCRALRVRFGARKNDGFVRECHGDLHLGNVALVDGVVTIFDCLEFSADLRWIDVMNEVAFTTMDLQDRKRPDLAHRFLDRYLERTGDYDGLRVLRFYMVYRALVRAKVHRLRANQPDVDAEDKARLLAQYRGYVALAKSLTALPRQAMLITHGLSGSGKTTYTSPLLETIGAVRIRSDVERKRLHGLPALARTGSGIAAGAYAEDVTALTYRRLLDLATTILEAGHTVIVDATFLKRAQRDAFRRLADALHVPFFILDFIADEKVLGARIAARERRHADASEADASVLEHQLRTQEPLQPNEEPFVRTIDSNVPLGADAEIWSSLLR